VILLVEESARAGRADQCRIAHDFLTSGIVRLHNIQMVKMPGKKGKK
jgi:hypothetical protein